MPEARNGEYEFDAGAGSAQRYGRKKLVCGIYTVSKAYEAKYGSKSKVKIGDLNASGHSSHRWGIAVDISAWGRTAAADRTHRNYSKDATIEFGKMWVDTGLVKNIWWCDGGDGSASAIDRYARSKNKPITIRCISGHDNHFHVDINDKKGASHMP
jgi:murein endopeptidase